MSDLSPSLPPMYWVYGKEDCPNCHTAKALIEAKGFRCVYIDVGKHPEFRDPKWTSVPQIFEIGHYIGGLSDLQELSIFQ